MFDKLCLFAHFDQDDLVADYVIYYLEAIRAVGFEIVVISTSRLSMEDVFRLQSVAHDVLLRENKGHDFASWALGIERYAELVSGQLMIANDSVYGPIGDLNRTLERLTSIPADFYGMIESAEIAPHLQSWLIVFEPAAHFSAAFRTLFRQDFYKMSKIEIIRNGEIGLSQSLLSHGFRMRSIFNGQFKNGENLKIPSNFSHFLWQEIIEFEDIPFLKVELLRVNPSRITSLDTWKDVVMGRSPDLVPMIENHLARTSIGRQNNALPIRDLSIFRNKLQHYIKHDYTHASAGHTILVRLNLLYFWLQRLWPAILRRSSYLTSCIRISIINIFSKKIKK
ncbi:hypothetical protein FPV16_22455 [Methylobacterium sp. W2]|uniref:rhamnan synthesis F family protein n=1 Tax=Methylobacterium sp. W2 TaxID=2598107 RepID=UPI001D0C9F67|nr:rhamnan synthesis F family protein [Methylobacterium sp. W2]MCC0808928.1 hypothetical protein [Methylobacterium sp. W2]